MGFFLQTKKKGNVMWPFLLEIAAPIAVGQINKLFEDEGVEE